MGIRQAQQQVVINGGNDGYNVSIQNNKLYINDEVIKFPKSLSGSVSISQNGSELIINDCKYDPKTKTFSTKKSFSFKFIFLLIILSIGALIVDHLYF